MNNLGSVIGKKMKVTVATVAAMAEESMNQQQTTGNQKRKEAFP